MMEARASGRHFYLDMRSFPIYLLALALVFNSFFRPQIATGNNLPFVVLFSVFFILIWLLYGLGLTGVLGLRVPRLFWPLGLYVFAAIASMVARLDFAGSSIQLALRTLVLLFMMLLVSNLVPTVPILERTLYILIGGFTIVALYAMADYFLYHRYTLSLFAGLEGIQDKNASGYYLMMMLFFAMFFLLSRSIPLFGKALMIGAAAVCLVAILLTLSRSALVGIVAGLGMVFVLYYHRVSKRTVALVLALLIVVAVATPSTFRDRLSTTFDFTAKHGSSNSSRIVLLTAGWRMYEANPVWGIGMGRFDENLPKYTTPYEQTLFGLAITSYPSAINQYLSALDDGGPLALVGILWMLYELLWGLHKRLRNPNAPYRYLLLGFAALWWSQVAYFFVEWQIKREIFWFMLGLTAAVFQLIPVQESPNTLDANTSGVE